MFFTADFLCFPIYNIRNTRKKSNFFFTKMEFFCFVHKKGGYIYTTSIFFDREIAFAIDKKGKA